MNVRVFNSCIAAGWLMSSVGAGLWWIPAGLMFGGVSMLALTFVVARNAGVKP